MSDADARRSPGYRSDRSHSGHAPATSRRDPWLHLSRPWLGLEHGLDLEMNRDLVSHDDAASLERGLEVDAEVASVDLRVGTETGTGAAEGVGTEAVGLKAKWDGLGYALQGEVAVEHKVVAVLPNTGRLVGHG